MFVKITSYMSVLFMLTFAFGCMDGVEKGTTEEKDKQVEKSKTKEKGRQKFHAGLSRGDLLEVDIDTNALTYSYIVTKGDLKGKPEGKGSGKLIKESELGKNAFRTDAGAFVVAIENKLLIGKLGEDFYVGVPQINEKIKLSDIAGVYNFVSYLPKGRDNDPEKTALQGTVEILPDGKGKFLPNGNIAELKKGQRPIPIKFVPQNDYVFSILSDDAQAKNYGNFLPRLDDKNEVFAVIDFADPKLLKGIGFAQKQKKLEDNSLNGSYLAYETGSPEVTEATVTGTSMILNNKKLKDSPANLLLNDPWTGVVKGQHADFKFYGIYSGTELYSLLFFPKGGAKPQAFIAIKE